MLLFSKTDKIGVESLSKKHKNNHYGCDTPDAIFIS